MRVIVNIKSIFSGRDDSQNLEYYTFKNFPKLNIKTFQKDSYWKSNTCTQNYTNALMVKFIWGFRDRGASKNSMGIRDWLER